MTWLFRDLHLLVIDTDRPSIDVWLMLQFRHNLGTRNHDIVIDIVNQHHDDAPITNLTSVSTYPTTTGRNTLTRVKLCRSSRAKRLWERSERMGTPVGARKWRCKFGVVGKCHWTRIRRRRGRIGWAGGSSRTRPRSQGLTSLNRPCTCPRFGGGETTRSLPHFAKKSRTSRCASKRQRIWGSSSTLGNGCTSSGNGGRWMRTKRTGVV